MKLKVYAVYDNAAAAFMVPHFMATHGLMTRAFADAVNDPQSNLNKHPADYRLFYIGDYDDTNGELIHCKPEPLGTGLDFVANKER